MIKISYDNQGDIHIIVKKAAQKKILYTTHALKQIDSRPVHVVCAPKDEYLIVVEI